MIIIILVALVIIYALSSIRILMQYERGVIFTLGKFSGVRPAGITLIFAPFQTMAEIATEKNSTIIFPAQFMTTVEEALRMVKKDSRSE